MPHRSSDSFYSGAYQTVRVTNSLTLTGETAANPRAIPSLPFSVTDSMARFSDNYTQLCASATTTGLSGE